MAEAKDKGLPPQTETWSSLIPSALHFPQKYYSVSYRGFSKRFPKVFTIFAVLCFVSTIGARFYYRNGSGRHPVSASLLGAAWASSPSISCPQYAPPTRMEEERAAVLSQWNNTRRFVSDRRLTFIKPVVLDYHRRLMDDVEVRGVPGMILECGVAKAGSSLLFAAIKHPDRCLHLFDTFEGMPEPSENDGPDVHRRYGQIQANRVKVVPGKETPTSALNTYYGNLENLLAYDQRQFKDAAEKGLLSDGNVFFHKGLFSDTVRPKGPVAYAHLDGDWYFSVLEPLKAVVPFLSEGGYIVFDDVLYYSGAKKAMADYFNLDMASLREVTSNNPTDFCTVTRGSLHFKISLHLRASVQRLTTVDMENSSYPTCLSQETQEVH